VLDTGVVELAVCFEVFDDTDGDWDVGVTRLQWGEDDDLWALHATPAVIEIFNEDTDQRFPDIAYDQEDGTLYVVYTDYQTSSPDSVGYLEYRYFDRDAPPYWSGPFDIRQTDADPM